MTYALLALTSVYALVAFLAVLVAHRNLRVAAQWQEIAETWKQIALGEPIE